MKYITAIFPVGLTLMAFYHNKQLSRTGLNEPAALSLAFLLAVVWLGFILFIRNRRILQFWLMVWFIMTEMLLLRIKINMEGLISLPAFFAWLSDTILLPFRGLVIFLGGPRQWETAVVLGCLYLALITVRIGLIARKNRYGDN